MKALVLGGALVGLLFVLAPGSAKPTTTAAKQIKVVIIGPGTANDQSWDNAWWDGATRAQRQYGKRVKITFAGGVFTPDKFTSVSSSFASKGYDLIIGVSGQPPALTLKLAKQFPKTTWCEAPFDYVKPSDRLATPPNLCRIDIEQQDGTFLGGVLAALLTKTKKVVAISGVPYPGATRQLEAFKLGVRCVRSDVEAFDKYLNSWDDVALGRSSVLSFMESGADIFLASLGQATRGMFEAAKTKPNTYVIAVNYDAHKQAPSVVLTTILWNVDDITYNVIKQHVNGTFPKHFYKSYNYQNIRVGEFTPFYALAKVVPATVRAKFNAIRQAVIAGKIKVPDETRGSPTIGKVGSADKIDVKSLGCKPAA